VLVDRPSLERVSTQHEVVIDVRNGREDENTDRCIGGGMHQSRSRIMNRRDALKYSNAALALGALSALPAKALAGSPTGLQPIIDFLVDADRIAEEMGYGDAALRGSFHTFVLATLTAASVDVLGSPIDSPAWVPFLPYYIPYVGPNPDTAYNYANIDPKGIYRITGSNGTESISTITMCRDGDYRGKILGTIVGEIDRLALKTDANGQYTVILAAKPQPQYEGEWFALPADATCLMSRRVLKEMSQRDGWSAIERLDRRAAPLDYTKEASEDLLQRIADAARHSTRFGLDYMTMVRRKVAQKGLVAIDQAPYGGLVQQVYYHYLFDLADDEAAILESDMPPTKYMSIVIFDAMANTIDWVHRQSCLNDKQIRIDGDGRFRAVLCPSDPGVANWLDTAGWEKGGLIWRWNSAEREPDVSARKIKLKDLGAELPADTRYVSAAERRAQITTRENLYQRRRY
jgi:hypothetical protein